MAADQKKIAEMAAMFEEGMKKKTQEQYPNGYNFATDIFDLWGEKDQSKVALRFHKDEESSKEIVWTYKALSEASKRVARWLTEDCECRKGDLVMVMTSRTPEWWIAVLALFRIGAVMVPAPVITNARQMQYRLLTAKTALVICTEQAAITLDEVDYKVKHKVLISEQSREGWLNFTQSYHKHPPDFPRVPLMFEERAACFFTSGSTGFPKLVVHNVEGFFLSTAPAINMWLGLRDGDWIWQITEVSWVKASITSLLAPFMIGACVFVVELGMASDEERFSKVLEILPRYPISLFCAPPSGYRIMVRQTENLRRCKPTHLRRCIGGGEQASPETLKLWRNAIGVEIHEGYGQTEGGAGICNFPYPGMNKQGSMGISTPNMKVVDEDMKPVEDGTVGQLVLQVSPNRPAGLFVEYLDDPVRTASVFRDGFYLTGDNVYKKEGFFYYVGRNDDIINTYLGARVGPFEVESALLEHAAVLESAACSSPDPDFNAVIKSFVVLNKEFKNRDKEELARELKEHVAATADKTRAPQKMEFMDELPKTATGKILRGQLRKREWEKVKDGGPHA